MLFCVAKKSMGRDGKAHNFACCSGIFDSIYVKTINIIIGPSINFPQRLYTPKHVRLRESVRLVEIFASLLSIALLE